MSQVWLITGANRGLGLAIAKAALTTGHRVVAAARNPASLVEALGECKDRLLPLALDVTDASAAQAAATHAVASYGRIDVLVNNAGYGQLGAFEEISLADIERQFATNVFGLMHVTRAVLPVMRRQRSGRVFNISSMAGYKGGGRFSVYAASKFAVVGFSESLAEELKEFGIHVTVVEPGYFRTDFLDSSSVAHGSTVIPDYALSTAAKRERSDTYNHQQAGDPAKLGAALVKIAAEATPPLHFRSALMRFNGSKQRTPRCKPMSTNGANFRLARPSEKPSARRDGTPVVKALEALRLLDRMAHVLASSVKARRRSKA